MLSSLFYNIKYAFSVRKPQLLMRLTKRFCGIKPKTRLRHVDLNILHECNLNCTHCFATAFSDSEKELVSHEQWKQVVSEAMDLGALSFNITGGECLLNEQLEEFVQVIQPNKNLISVSTNGLLLDDKRAASLYKSGVDIISISLDSGFASEHDEFRKHKGSWDAAISAIKAAQKNNLKVIVVSTVHHGNVNSEGFLELIKLTKRLNCLVIIARAVPIGNWKNSKEIELTKDDIKVIQGYTKKYPHIRTDFESNFDGCGCPAAIEKLYITPNGEILACPYLHVTFGNIHEKSLMESRDLMLSKACMSAYNKKCVVAEAGEIANKIQNKTNVQNHDILN
jgi:MoaA/NifB/PqqE/SkfB family radical SAM enzyme